jgi:hypothetical protein
MVGRGPRRIPHNGRSAEDEVSMFPPQSGLVRGCSDINDHNHAVLLPRLRWRIHSPRTIPQLRLRCMSCLHVLEGQTVGSCKAPGKAVDPDVQSYSM